MNVNKIFMLLTLMILIFEKKFLIQISANEMEYVREETQADK